ncbi:hypothetical protein [Bradyrhizobium elkanii]|uniref:Uncharacterized protein n=1 Tax=Bradyrhizobium elkanii TaxID=29448 RepID=A0ABV4EZE6_BRAEL|nr:hypothetical protein [Bradyrhizobium elkanii]MCP1757545.1 hypothetical protein [Bradyrhizobium elkanii]MCP1983059.1 hypothetical protein [Bradyrhizobium elkanii]MCS3691448.1 hypothetical protein [Bradyrhizobium elkanii]MCS3882158.1 hypothetical protein [Bradyrhizobium elkanii]MCS4218918.1 hypothetical protein [Bradyrhizobium elkanii]
MPNNNQEADGVALGRPSRRAALQLLLGGAAVMLTPDGRLGMMEARAEAASNKELKRDDDST